MQWAPCVAIGNDTVQADLVKIGCLELQHLVNTSTVDGVSGLADLLVISLTTKREVISFSQYLSRRSNVGLCAHVEILINSAKPFRTCASGRVFRKEKSRNV